MQFVLTYAKKPITTNAERAGNRWNRAEHTKEWRTAFTWIARKQKIPVMKWVNVTAQPFQKRGRLQDTAACNPSVKAAIDGLVDAGMVPDDSGEFVRMITFLPCRRGEDSLTLIIEGEENA
jgi:crossover junction endodeoxyribonuclease RusA